MPNISIVHICYQYWCISMGIILSHYHNSRLSRSFVVGTVCSTKRSVACILHCPHIYMMHLNPGISCSYCAFHDKYWVIPQWQSYKDHGWIITWDIILLDVITYTCLNIIPLMGIAYSSNDIWNWRNSNKIVGMFIQNLMHNLALLQLSTYEIYPIQQIHGSCLHISQNRSNKIPKNVPRGYCASPIVKWFGFREMRRLHCYTLR